MRTLYLRILITFAIALACGTLVMFWVSAMLSRSVLGELSTGMERLQLQQARRAYEDGGRAALRAYLEEVNGLAKGKRYLLDASGHDLVTGEDRAALAALTPDPDQPPVKYKGQLLTVRHSPDRKYTLVIAALPAIPISTFYPYFAVAFLLVLALGIWLSVSIVQPLHSLSGAMNRFGAGDLGARAEVARRDEIGDAARAFNNMAERISTLLVAERRLLQDVSHELRSPLARLSFAAELMNGSPDPEAALARMKREIAHLSRMVGTLLEMTSAEGDPASCRFEPVDLDEIVRQVVEDCAFETSARHVSFQTQIGASVPMEGDPELLRRAVENVLRNAIRYAPEHSAVQVELLGESGKTVFRVRDHGPGVPEESLPRIFDPFYRVEKSRDTAQGGVGLGLSIVERVVHLHHGQVRAENAFPGLRIEITFPEGRHSRG